MEGENTELYPAIESEDCDVSNETLMCLEGPLSVFMVDSNKKIKYPFQTAEEFKVIKVFGRLEEGGPTTEQPKDLICLHIGTITYPLEKEIKTGSPSSGLFVLPLSKDLLYGIKLEGYLSLRVMTLQRKFGEN
jgi:hypothetical protein